MWARYIKEEKTLKTFRYVVANPAGLQAQAAGQIAQHAAGFRSLIRFTCKGKTADASRVIALMGLGLQQGDVLNITVEGSDEAQAAASVFRFIREVL